MIVRSHGLSKVIVDRAKACGLQVVDATCPFVSRAQKLAKKLVSQGYQVILVGDPGHPEVCAIVGSAEGEVTVADSPKTLKQLKVGSKVGLLAQTTQDFANFRACAGELLGRAQELRIYNTICTATEKRMAAAVELATKVQLMLVIGGKNSANTAVGPGLSSYWCSTYHIETEAELDPEWFRGLEHVGVTAGASTPKWMIEG